MFHYQSNGENAPTPPGSQTSAISGTAALLSQTTSISSAGTPFLAGSDLGEKGETSFNAELEIRAMKARIDDLENQNAEMREKLDRFDGESAEIRLLVEKYKNR